MPPARAVLVLAALGLLATGVAVFLPPLYGSEGLRAQGTPVQRRIGILFQVLNEKISFADCRLSASRPNHSCLW